MHVGTSGYSYREWKGTFYPESIEPKEMLSFYAGHFGAVEINNTFYRLPKPDVLNTWAAQVPETFRFSIKASRKITHFSRLGESAREAAAYLLSTLRTLGDRLGVILFQLPPNFRKDLARLEDFVAVLPEGTPAAWEFRHASWNDDSVLNLLRERGMALVHADTDDSGETEPIVRTAPWGYLRLRRTAYSEGDLSRWAERVADAGWDEVYLFFKHEDEGAGPRMAARFGELIGPDT